MRSLILATCPCGAEAEFRGADIAECHREMERQGWTWKATGKMTESFRCGKCGGEDEHQGDCSRIPEVQGL